MAYKYSELEKQALEAIPSISLEQGCDLFNEKFKSETEFKK